MSLRIFSAAAVVLAGAAGLQTVAAAGGLASLLASPAQAATGTDEAERALWDSRLPVSDPAAMDGEPGEDPGRDSPPVPALAPNAAAPETALPGQSFSDKIGASADEYRILISLQQRRQELDAWESELDTRALLVQAAEQRVEERLDELRAVRDEIADLLDQIDEQEETRIRSLVSTYERMKAKDAARILAGLDSPTAIMVLSRMRDANLAGVLGAMNTGDAARMTEMLAARADMRALIGEAGLSGET